MATDRTYIVCEGCKTYVFVDKWSPMGGFEFRFGLDIINNFLSDHVHCTEEMAGRPDFGFTFGREERCWSKGYTEYTGDEDSD
jgi:hypothetical protein